MNPRSTKDLDKHIGKRIRMRRNELKISQGDLGEAIGVSFQQIQKYENGINRVGAARLQQIAATMETPASFFTQDAAGAKTGKIDSVMDTFMATKDGLIIAQAFVRIGDANVRRTIADFVDRLSRSRDGNLMQMAE